MGGVNTMPAKMNHFDAHLLCVAKDFYCTLPLVRSLRFSSPEILIVQVQEETELQKIKMKNKET